jgi:hypothetical protein
VLSTGKPERLIESPRMLGWIGYGLENQLNLAELIVPNLPYADNDELWQRI